MPPCQTTSPRLKKSAQLQHHSRRLPTSFTPIAEITTTTSCFARMKITTLHIASKRAERSPAAQSTCKQLSPLSLYSFRLKKLEEHCSEDFNKHWNCLDFNNFEYRFCREPEKVFNACVLKKLVSVSLNNH
ncbi:ndufa8, NADH-ubiquinone oxidoreductase complex I 19kd subunit, variant 2 [Entomophthora muscae]|uniref:Ndufa8, NADH-ubiquinone oxidoreductase complex I 19kd subunit, variant 2 n=1 Tax=Entomophthora muscae TaxID=34485 RepID=A0ACC2SFG0_9FUNG|nr:ndufa8, NADH-ubiquinone oxidoreductase complex I 19kd subunit, variant 2 [Entomophthora muscae]